MQYGMLTSWNRCLSRRHTLENLRARLETFERAVVQPLWDGNARRIDLRRQDGWGRCGLHAVPSSYSGHLCHGARVPRMVAEAQGEKRHANRLTPANDRPPRAPY